MLFYYMKYKKGSNMLDAAIELVEPLNRFGQILEVTCVNVQALEGDGGSKKVYTDQREGADLLLKEEIVSILWLNSHPHNLSPFIYT